jgi:toxin ParE1/3/4
MAGELIWARAALDDIEAIAAFIARDSRTHARRIVERIFDGAELLLKHPAMGTSIPELSPNQIRELQLDGFRMLFERQGDDLQVLAVIHGHLLADSFPRPFQIP